MWLRLDCGSTPGRAGKKKGKIWSLDVNGNFRLLFKFDENTGQFYDVDYDDPH